MVCGRRAGTPVALRLPMMLLAAPNPGCANSNTPEGAWNALPTMALMNRLSAAL
jgi:hypothetical protein